MYREFFVIAGLAAAYTLEWIFSISISYLLTLNFKFLLILLPQATLKKVQMYFLKNNQKRIYLALL